MFASNAQAYMEVAWGIIQFLQSGLATNWFGLACPSHCGAPSWGSITSAFLLGFLCGLASILYLLVIAWGFRPAIHLQGHPGQAVPSPAARFAQYVHEHHSRRQ